MRLKLKTELDVFVSGDHVKGSPETRFSMGEPDRINNLKVTLEKSNACVDITQYLPQQVLNEFEEQMCDEGRKHDDEGAQEYTGEEHLFDNDGDVA